MVVTVELTHHLVVIVQSFFFLFRSFHPTLLAMIIYTWIAMYLFLKLAVIVARELGVPILNNLEIGFFPVRFIVDLS